MLRHFFYHGRYYKNIDVPQQNPWHLPTAEVLFSRKQNCLKKSSICDHCLQSDKNPFFDKFTILGYRNKKYFFEIKVSCLINQPVMITKSS